MFFGYTQCPDVCPTTLSILRDAMQVLGEDAKRVQVLFVTVDPARDTAPLLAQYVPSFYPSFLGLYTVKKAHERWPRNSRCSMPRTREALRTITA